jgi:hypothetical protein
MTAASTAAVRSRVRGRKVREAAAGIIVFGAKVANDEVGFPIDRNLRKAVLGRRCSGPADESTPTNEGVA